MARQKGIIKLVGTIGELNFYNRKGTPVARAAGGGFTSEAVKTGANMVRVRENAGEFGAVSKAKKLLRLGFHPFLKDVKDVTLHGRMMTLFQTIKVLDTESLRGQRLFEKGLATPYGRQLLLDFDLTPKSASILLPNNGTFDATTQSYTLTPILPKNLKMPKGATGLQVSLGILQIDFAEATFKFHGSTPAYLDPTTPATPITLTPESLPSGTGICFAVLQVRYFQEVNGSRFLFNDLNAQGLDIVGVY
jgi:hypothetical protein